MCLVKRSGPFCRQVRPLHGRTQTRSPLWQSDETVLWLHSTRSVKLPWRHGMIDFCAVVTRPPSQSSRSAFAFPSSKIEGARPFPVLVPSTYRFRCFLQSITMPFPACPYPLCYWFFSNTLPCSILLQLAFTKNSIFYYHWRRSSVIRTSVFGQQPFPDLRPIYGWQLTTMWINYPLWSIKLGQLSFPFLQGR